MKTEYAILIPLFLQVIGLVLALVIDPYIKKQERGIMLLITVLILTHIFQNVGDYVLTEYFCMPYVRTIVAIYGYSIRPLIILLFIYLVGGKKRYIPLWVLTGVNAVIYLTALFTGKISFYIRPDNHFGRGALSFTCYVVSGILFAYLIYLTFLECKKVRKRECLIPVFNILMVIGSLILEWVFNYDLNLVSYLTMAIVSSAVFYYIWLHLRFVREHEKALMAEQRIQIMMSQIQPHFLYNTLTTIQALCMIDPQKAFTVTERFGKYLRQNIDSLSQPNLIPFTKELEHTRIYADIECVRFDNISIEYDTPETDFMLPALTIQPLVENSIRHGIRIRKHGIVKVSTARTENGYDIIVEDNGTGFDPALAEQSDNTHIGLRNIKERIKTMCGGTLLIETTEDVGTKITIHIPDQNSKQNYKKEKINDEK